MFHFQSAFLREQAKRSKAFGVWGGWNTIGLDELSTCFREKDQKKDGRKGQRKTSNRLQVFNILAAKQEFNPFLGSKSYATKMIRTHTYIYIYFFFLL